MILALDLSTACVGWAKYDRSGRLLDYGRITPPEDHRFLKIKYLVNQLNPLMLEADSLVVEGIFLNTFAKGAQNVTGFELLARLSGAVINSYLQSHSTLPVLYKATEARKLVGVKGSAQKAEIQLWVIRNFHVGKLIKQEDDVTADITDITEDYLQDYDDLIDAEYASLNAKEMVKETFKKHMGAISRKLEDETMIGEDIADAILLGLAFVKDARNEKSEDGTCPTQKIP
jgi:Holliday junction resolvasome RuvABC endonuclease subunit